MQAIEALVVATLAALMSAAGIKYLSPEAQATADQVVFFATVKDRNLVIASEITGRNMFEGITSPITPEEIAALAEEMKAAGTVQNIDMLTPEITQEAEAAVTRWNSTQ
jgi:hypothetical protein